MINKLMNLFKRRQTEYIVLDMRCANFPTKLQKKFDEGWETSERVVTYRHGGETWMFTVLKRR